jgi:hypothetical protein
VFPPRERFLPFGDPRVGLVRGPSGSLACMAKAHLARELDDLATSGELEMNGRGKKRRYLLVPQGGSA